MDFSRLLKWLLSNGPGAVGMFTGLAGLVVSILVYRRQVRHDRAALLVRACGVFRLAKEPHTISVEVSMDNVGHVPVSVKDVRLVRSKRRTERGKRVYAAFKGGGQYLEPGACAGFSFTVAPDSEEALRARYIVVVGAGDARFYSRRLEGNLHDLAAAGKLKDLACTLPFRFPCL